MNDLDHLVRNLSSALLISKSQLTQVCISQQKKFMTLANPFSETCRRIGPDLQTTLNLQKRESSFSLLGVVLAVLQQTQKSIHSGIYESCLLYSAFKYILKEILKLSYKRCITAVFCTLKDALVSRMANRTFGTLSGDHHLSCWLCRSQNITYIDTQSGVYIQYP